MRKLLPVLVLLSLLPGLALAGSGAGAINMSFNTSARANAMGNAGVAVTWDQDTNHWANPALLAFRPGIHYRSFETKLLAPLANDIFLTNEEITVGAYGVTFLLATGPVQGNYLDMGLHESRDEYGVSLGTFHSYMESTSWGVGVDGVQVLENLLPGRTGKMSRFVSLAGGFTKHQFKDQFAPDDVLQFGSGIGRGTGTAMSLGYVLQLKYDELSRGDGLVDNGFLGLKFGASYGASILNKTDEFIGHGDVDQSDPFPRAYLSGWAANAQISLADDLREKLNDIGFGFLGDVFNPLVSFTKSEQTYNPGYSWNSQANEYVYGRDTSDLMAEKGQGWELGLANVFFIREGHFSAQYGEIDGPTKGGGWKIQAGRLGGFRSDWADFPQATGLSYTHRETWSVWVDPLAIADTFF